MALTGTLEKGLSQFLGTNSYSRNIVLLSGRIIFLTKLDKILFLTALLYPSGVKAEPAAKARAEVWTPPMAPACHADLILGLESRISGWILIPLKPLARVPLVLARSPLVSAPVELSGHPSIQNGGFSE